MKRTSSAHVHHYRRAAAIGLVAALIVAACGDEDDDSDVTSDTTTAAPAETGLADTTPVTEPTVPPTLPPDDGIWPNLGNTLERVSFDQEAAIVEHPNHPTCALREGELIVLFDDDVSVAGIELLIGDVFDLEPVIATVGAGDLHLLRIGIGPLDAASILTANGIAASPNYVFAFSPGWLYSPFDAPKSVDPPDSSPPSSEADPTIAVLDTGYLPMTGGTAGDVQPKEPPLPPGVVSGGPIPEVTNGPAAGHGTFIVNQLLQLLPNATYVPVGVSPRYMADDGYVPPALGTEVNIRDDSTVTSALTTFVDSEIQYLNMSLGSYGCTTLKAPPDDVVTPAQKANYWANFNPADMDTWLTPLALGLALADYADRTGVQVFAASGNDGNGTSQEKPATSEIFYPAGWALDHEWLHSVASDPKTTGSDPKGDYSNRVRWVETKAHGSRVVSQLPDGMTWGDEGWYEWSGTSFAAPCALARYVITEFTDPSELANFDRGYLAATPPEYHECLMNLTDQDS